MRRPRWMAIAALLPAVALTIASCDSGGGTGDGGDGGGEITVAATEPENPLLPGNTAEAGGSKVIDALFTGLIRYDAKTTEPVNAHAETIDISESGDKITFTLKEDWTFHDGTPVMAKNYVDAWNYAAYSPNGQQLASFFEQVEGYQDVHTEDPDGEDGPKEAPEPKTDKMSGLKVEGDYSFSVTFTAPHAAFAKKVGYNAFMPLPDSFFKDPAAFEKKPIGSGPFKYVDRTPDQDLTIEAYEDYKGEDKPKVQRVKFMFGDISAQYKDVQDNTLDFLNSVPPEALAGNLWQQDLEGRSAAQKTALGIQLIAFPLYDKKYESVDFRHAVSMAIDRKKITDTVFEGTRVPVNGYGVPGLPLWEDGACGEWCEYNPTEAKKLFDKSGFEGDIVITSNTDGGHKDWIDAACGQIKAALDTECKLDPVPDFGKVREKIDAKEMSTLYRSGWGADYPHVENFLNPLYRTGASSNDGGYSNPQVDQKLADADKAVDDAEATKLYHEAEVMVAEDMPVIPLWMNPYVYGWSDRLKPESVVMHAFKNELELTSVELK